MTTRPARAETPLASLATVARAAGVSVATVSRIVNGKRGRASAETVARVEQAVARLGYRPNPVGRALKQRASRVVALLAPNLDNPAMAAIAVSTEAALRDAGYVTILCDTHDRAELQDEYLAAMRSQFVAGYVMVSAVASRGSRPRCGAATPWSSSPVAARSAAAPSSASTTAPRGRRPPTICSIVASRARPC